MRIVQHVDVFLMALKLALINKRVEVRLSWDTCVSKLVNTEEMENPKICF